MRQYEKAIEIAVKELDLATHAEFETLAKRLGSLLYWGDGYMSGELDTYESLSPKVIDLYQSLDIPHCVWVDTDCDCMELREPEFDYAYALGEFKEELDNLCCDLARDQFMDSQRYFFYDSWVSVKRKDILECWLGKNSVEAISYQVCI